jgi:hypothetical protein
METIWANMCGGTNIERVHGQLRAMPKATVEALVARQQPPSEGRFVPVSDEGSVNLRFFLGAARAGKMTEFEGAPQFEKYGLAPNLKDRQ